LIRAFTDEVGQDRTLAMVRTVIKSLALDSGMQLAKRMGGNSIACFVKGLSAFRQGGAYEMEQLELSEERYDFNITRCQYAEMYKELGMADLGFILSCSRDFDLIAGFNAKMTLRRTRTIMEGYDHCDFRIAME